MKQVLSILAIGAITIFGSCTKSATEQAQTALQAQAQTIDSLKMALVRQQVIDSMNAVAEKKVAAVQTSTRTTAIAKKPKKSPVRTQTSYAQNSVQSYAGNTAPVVYQEAPVAVPEKRGWSAKAKGAVIGTTAGAAAGAIINKRNRTAGAVIGGVLGAGAGTGIGAIIDKKNGR